MLAGTRGPGPHAPRGRAAAGTQEPSRRLWEARGRGANPEGPRAESLLSSATLSPPGGQSGRRGRDGGRGATSVAPQEPCRPSEVTSAARLWGRALPHLPEAPLLPRRSPGTKLPPTASRQRGH